MRLDVFLAGKGFYKSRSRASAAIKSGAVKIDGRKVTAPAFEVTGNEAIEASETGRYVSRAGEKLEHALDVFGIGVGGACALDIGASTGGFTDCLLKRGAAFVYALDVGSGQLDNSLRGDSRVKCIENFNARSAKRTDFERGIDIITMDVSFISQSLIYPACADVLPAGKIMITLVKPQFEAGREHVGKGGIVHDTDGKLIASINKKLTSAAKECGFEQTGFTKSPVTGGDGNTEYLALFVKTE